MKIFIEIDVQLHSSSPLVRKWQVLVNQLIVASGYSRAADCCLEQAGEALGKFISSGIMADMHGRDS